MQICQNKRVFCRQGRFFLLCCNSLIQELSYYTKEKRNEMEKEITILGSIDSEQYV